MDRFFIGEEYLALENKRVAELKYFIVEESRTIEEASNNIATYGFEVEKVCGAKVEKEVVYDVTTERKLAISIINNLKKNKVMPVHLRDIIEDIL